MEFSTQIQVHVDFVLKKKEFHGRRTLHENIAANSNSALYILLRLYNYSTASNLCVCYKVQSMHVCDVKNKEKFKLT